MTNFKAIIVGGGPVGLITAHCLSKAGIDFEILERRPDVALNTGASNALWPQSVRVFDQLGLLDALKEISYPTLYKANVLADGNLLDLNDLYAQIAVQLGHPWLFLHRGQLVDMLAQHLPDSANRLHFNKQVASIETTPQGVTVTCLDGTTHDGTIIIGCDGANSTIRRLMTPSSPKTSTPTPMKTTYVGLFGSCTLLPSLSPNTLYETHGPKYTIQLGVHHTRAFFVLYHRLPTPTTTPHSFTDAEVQDLVARYSDVHVTPNHRFGDVWKDKLWSHMAHLEEGLAERWYSDDGRVVLVGDSAHKMMPNAGLGFNSGVESAAALVNVLRGVLLSEDERQDGGGRIDSGSLVSALAVYEKLRKSRARKAIQLSGLYARVVTWDNLVWRVADRYISPRVDGNVLLLRVLVSGLIKEGVVLDFVEEAGFREGRVKWVNPRVVLKGEDGSTPFESDQHL